MNKAQLKEIRAYVANFPRIQTQCVSGYNVSYKPSEYGGQLERVLTPYVYTVDTNHYRRVKRAFKRHGNDGVAHYVASLATFINKQKQGDKAKK